MTSIMKNSSFATLHSDQNMFFYPMQKVAVQGFQHDAYPLLSKEEVS